MQIEDNGRSSQEQENDRTGGMSHKIVANGIGSNQSVGQTHALKRRKLQAAGSLMRERELHVTFAVAGCLGDIRHLTDREGARHPNRYQPGGARTERKMAQ